MRRAEHSIPHVRSGKPCRFCNEANYSMMYAQCPELAVMRNKGICFICAFWELKAQTPQHLIIAHRIYSIGKGGKERGMRGMGGRVFQIEYFTGERFETNDLWGGALIPPRWRDRMPNTARFLGGAGAETINGVTYFNESRGAS
jgi:hypothetical protein